MVQFLSEEWVRALDRAARERSDAGPWSGTTVVFQQVVSDAPGGECVFHLEMGGDGIRVASGAATDPDVTFSTDLRTAVAIARGTLNVQQALAAGRYRLHGDLDVLARNADALVALGDLFRTVRLATVFPDPG